MSGADVLQVACKNFLIISDEEHQCESSLMRELHEDLNGMMAFTSNG